MLPSNDIPFWLINLALLAVVSLPFVILIAIHSASRNIVRPVWALRQLLDKDLQHNSALESTPLPRATPEGRAASRVALSQFGR
jgi:hypothetical protein